MQTEQNETAFRLSLDIFRHIGKISLLAAELFGLVLWFGVRVLCLFSVVFLLLLLVGKIIHLFFA